MRKGVSEGSLQGCEERAGSKWKLSQYQHNSQTVEQLTRMVEQTAAEPTSQGCSRSSNLMLEA